MLHIGQAIHPVQPRQQGAITVLTVFVMLMAVGAFAVFGLGQAVWQREELQRIADIVAKSAASDIANAQADFPTARAQAERNGLRPNVDELRINCNVQGTNTLLPPDNCQASVLVNLSRNVDALFLGTREVSAVAEATVSPFITGLVGTNLLSANLNGGPLSPLLEQIGVRLGISAVGFQGLLQSDAEVDLIDLAVRVGAIDSADNASVADFLNEPVNARDLLRAAIDIADQPLAVSLPNGGPLANTDFFLRDIFAIDSGGSDQLPGASVRLGNLAFASSLAAARGLSAGQLQINVGETARISVLNPPQMFVAVKQPGGPNPLAFARAEQLSAVVRVAGLIELTVNTGRGEVTIRDIECRLPQSDTVVRTDFRSVPLDVNVNLIAIQTIGTQLASASANNQAIRGFPDPTLEGRYSFEVGQGVASLLPNLRSSFNAINVVAVLVNPPLQFAFNNLLGPVLNNTLTALGLQANEVVVQLNGMDCFNTAVLTR